MTDIAKIAAGLTKAQRAFLLAASRRPKKWMTIRRHAKLNHHVRVHGLGKPLGLVEHEAPCPWRWQLTPLGLAVRAHLKENTDAAE